MNNKTKKIKTKIGGNKSETLQDIVGNKLYKYTTNTSEYIKDKGARLIKNHDNKSNSIIKNVFDKGSAAVISNINDVLQNPSINKSFNDAIKTSKNIMGNLNEKLNNPEFKEKTKETMDNLADYTGIVVQSMDKPVNKIVDILNEAGTKTASGILSGAIKVGTDAMAAIPGVGAVIELGKMANDASKAAEDVVDATSKASSEISKIIEETTKNINENLQNFERKKKESSMILGRTNKSINTFMKGGRRKTKKVRFMK